MEIDDFDINEWLDDGDEDNNDLAPNPIYEHFGVNKTAEDEE